MNLPGIDVWFTDYGFMNSDHILLGQLNGSPSPGKEQKRLLDLEDSGLLVLPTPLVLTELLELVSKLLEFPIGWIGLMDRDSLHLKVAIGLSQWGLTHNLATQRSIPRLDTFCTHVVDSEQPLLIEDTIAQGLFAEIKLAQSYGVRSYLGAPLMQADDQGNCFCVGTIALMDCQPHPIKPSDRQWMQILARWCMSEYHLAQKTPPKSPEKPSRPQFTPSGKYPPKNRSAELPSLPDPCDQYPDAQMRLKTIHDLVQSCHNPMTAVMGLARMLEREIYGPLTPKQREYVEVINQSIQTLLIQAQDIQGLATLPHPTDPTDRESFFPTHLELLGQQVINQLKPIALNHHLELDFSAEVTSLPWYGDPEAIKQILTHLLQGGMSLTKEPGTLYLNLSYPPDQAKFTLWFLSFWVDNPIHPGETPVKTTLDTESSLMDNTQSPSGISLPLNVLKTANLPLPSTSSQGEEPLPFRLQLCQQLLEHLQGTLVIENSAEMGKRYTITIPRIEPAHPVPAIRPSPENEKPNGRGGFEMNSRLIE